MSWNPDTFIMSDVVCIGESDKAIKCEAPDFKGSFWVPKSVIDDDSEVYKTYTEGDLIVSYWWADKIKGWV